jgi:DNA replication protein DnaC
VCLKCADTGKLDGKYCECYNELAKVYAAEEINGSSAVKLHGFESVDIQLYPEAAREEMRAQIKVCCDFARRFGEPDNANALGLLFVGATGLGKTHISLAIADTVIKKGRAVIYRTASEIITIMTDAYFGRGGEDEVRAFKNTDLLIIDDLGSEFAKNQYTITALFELLNYRLNHSYATVISTNLMPQDLNTRYGDRIVSRMFQLKRLFFVGKDIRNVLAAH